MKCTIAHFVAALGVVALVIGIIVAVLRIPGFVFFTICYLGAVAAILGFCWAVATVIECWNGSGSE
jgi:hypothetical protein